MMTTRQVEVLTSDLTDINVNDVESLWERISAVHDLLITSEPELTEAEVKVVREATYDKLLPVVKKLDPKKCAEILPLCGQIFSEFTVKMGVEIAVALKDLARGLVVRGGSTKSSVTGLEIMRSCFLEWPGSENAVRLEVDHCEKTLTDIIVHAAKNTPSVLKCANETLGALVKSYPAETKERANVIFHYLTTQLQAQMTSRTKKPDLPIIEGCLNGVSDFMTAFGFEEEEDDNDQQLELVYDVVRKVAPYPSQDQNHRRTAMRAAVKLFADHCEKFFAKFATDEVKYWYETLDAWAFSRNRDDHRIGWRAMLSLFKAVGAELSRSMNERSFVFLFKKLKDILIDPNSTPKQTSLAVQGYGNLAAACKSALSAEEVSLMLFSLLQRTEDMFVNPQNEGDFDNNLHLSSYVEALTCVIGQVASPSVTSVFMFENILVRLIAKFPFLPHQYHGFAMHALAQALSVSNRTLVENVALRGVMETCSHPVVTKTEEEAAIVELGVEKIISVASFLPFWRGMLSVCKAKGDDLEKAFFDAVISSFVQIIEKLDFSMSEDREPDVDDADETPKAAKDFTIMANLVQMAASFIGSDSVKRSLFRPWVERLGFCVVSYSTR